MGFVADLRSVLRERDFRHLYSTRVTSQFTDGVFQVALASVFFFSPEQQTSAQRVAAAFAVLLLPYSIVGPFAGVLLDRWRRQQVLTWANMIRAAMVVGVAGLVFGGVENALFYTAVLACLSVNRFFLAGLSAALPHVVRRDDLVMANSVSTTSGTIVAMCGAGAGFLLRLLFGEGSAANGRVLLVAAALYLLAATISGRMARDLLGPDFAAERKATREAVRHVLTGMVDGFRHVRSHRPAALALTAITAHRFFFGLSTVAVILLFRNHFNDPADVDAGLAGLASVFAASGLGFFVAALVTPEVTHRLTKQGWIVACFLLAALAQFALVAWLDEVSVVLGGFQVGFAAQGSKICVDTIVQTAVDDAYRGRVFSFYDVLFNVAFVGSAAFAAATVPADGVSVAIYAFIGLGYAVTAVWYGRASRLNQRALSEA